MFALFVRLSVCVWAGIPVSNGLPSSSIETDAIVPFSLDAATELTHCVRVFSRECVCCVAFPRIGRKRKYGQKLSSWSCGGIEIIYVCICIRIFKPFCLNEYKFLIMFSCNFKLNFFLPFRLPSVSFVFIFRVRFQLSDARFSHRFNSLHYLCHSLSLSLRWLVFFFPLFLFSIFFVWFVTVTLSPITNAHTYKKKKRNSRKIYSSIGDGSRAENMSSRNGGNGKRKQNFWRIKKRAQMPFSVLFCVSICEKEQKIIAKSCDGDNENGGTQRLSSCSSLSFTTACFCFRIPRIIS